MISELTCNSSDADKEQLIRSYLSIWNSPDNLKFLSYTGIEFDRKTVSGWVYGLTEDSGIKYFVCKKKENMSGIAVINQNPITGYELYGLGIQKEYKRNGMGSKLVLACIEDAGRTGYKSVETTVFTDNIPMLLLCLKTGFRPVAISYRKRYDGVDTLTLRYRIGEKYQN